MNKQLKWIIIFLLTYIICWFILFTILSIKEKFNPVPIPTPPSPPSPPPLPIPVVATITSKTVPSGTTTSLKRRSRFTRIVKIKKQIDHPTNTPLASLKSKIKKFTRGITTPNFFALKPAKLAPVLDQGDCGSCWAFVITGLLSDCTTMRVLKFGKHFSAQQLLSCYGYGTGCKGEIPEDVLLWMDETGFKLLPEEDGPYLQTKGGTVTTKCVIPKKGVMIKEGTVKSLCGFIERESVLKSKQTHEEKKIIKENIYRMKAELTNSGPFFGSITVWDDFVNFNGHGIYIKNSKIKRGGHAVEVVGWVDNGHDPRNIYKGGYWICKNTWGVDWGYLYDTPGYFAIRMGTNECGIESRSGTAVPDISFIGKKDTISSSLYYDNYFDYSQDVLYK
jgi:hypothetical protein